MHISEVKEHLSQQPFVPFRIHVSDGASSDVPHPEFVLVTKWALHVGHDSDSDNLPQRVTRVAVGHITCIEEIDSGAEVRLAS